MSKQAVKNTIAELTDEQYFAMINQNSVLTIPEELQNDPEYVYGWRRVLINGAADTKNLMRLNMERWEPVRKDELPESSLFRVMAEFPQGISTFMDNFAAGAVVYKDVMLMRCPRRFVDMRTAAKEAKKVRREAPQEVINLQEGGQDVSVYKEQSSEVAFGGKPFGE